MIRLTRQRGAIPARFRGTQRIANERSLLAARRDYVANGGTKFDYLKSSMWSPAKAQLELESNGKCAYCEALARANAHCDVEHFRPKSVYWWLALCYDNYLLACQICNQTHKSDQYPVAAPLAGPAIIGTATDAQINNLADQFAPDPAQDNAQFTFAVFENGLRGEDPDLINPYHEDPEPFFTWVADSVLGEVEIRPATAAGRAHQRARSSIDILGLNREKLRQLRWQTFQTLDMLCQTLAAALPAPLRQQVEQSLRSALEDGKAFAAMNRHLVRKIHGLNP